MNYEHLTDDELIVAVAEAKGWRLSKVARINGEDGFIFESPTGDRGTCTMRELMDYRQPAEYMALMGEIWKKDKKALLGEKCVYQDVDLGDGCAGFHQNDELWRAICIAWLITCGGKK